MAPPDSIPNSAVKRSCADDSVGFPHVKVGHRQTPNTKKAPVVSSAGAFLVLNIYNMIYFLMVK